MNDRIRKYLDKKLGKLYQADVLSTANNRLWVVSVGSSKYVLKEPQDRSTVFSLEHDVFERLGLRNYLSSKEEPYLLYDYIPGIPLSEALRQDKPEHLNLNDLFDIITSVGNIPSTGAGKLDTSYSGSHSLWPKFVFDYMNKQFRNGEGIPDHITDLVRKKLEVHIGICHDAELVTIPMDLNMNNFVVNDAARINVINIPVLWRGDWIAPYAELAAHIYRTSLWKPFMYAIKECRVDQRRINLYALLMSYTTLAYAVRFSDEDLEKNRPWGNEQATFFEIIEYFASKLQIYE